MTFYLQTRRNGLICGPTSRNDHKPVMIIQLEINRKKNYLFAIIWEIMILLTSDIGKKTTPGVADFNQLGYGGYQYCHIGVLDISPMLICRPAGQEGIKGKRDCCLKP